MKKYDRESKQWLDEKVIEKKLAKRKTCKGGREHDWILCLPPYVKTDSILGLDKVEEYYKIEDERESKDIELDKKLQEIGVEISNYRWLGRIGINRHYICSVCLKRKYE